jgi:hypothetical protein
MQGHPHGCSRGQQFHLWPDNLSRNLKSLVRYLTQNPTKSLCQPSDSGSSRFLELRDFGPFCAVLSDNLVTAEILNCAQI